MAYSFEAVSSTEVKALAKTHPFKVIYSAHDGIAKRRYFETRVEAEEWRAWAVGIAATALPRGVTIDLRQRKPFYARKVKHGKRIAHYSATVQEAVKWLATK